MYREYAPPPALAGLVRAFWSVEEEHTGATEAHRFLPERSVRLTFYAGESYFEQAGALIPLPPAYVLGLYGRPVGGVSRGLTRAMGAELYPWGAVQLLGLSSGVQALRYPVREASLVRLARTVRALLQEGSVCAAVEVLQGWLVERAAKCARERGPAVHAAIALYHEPGRARVNELAEELGLSTRSLERQFRAEIGVAPKALARLIRFEEAHNRLWMTPGQSLTDLAYDLGYADQAHFARDFRSFASMSPTEFLQYIAVVRVGRPDAGLLSGQSSGPVR